MAVCDYRHARTCLSRNHLLTLENLTEPWILFEAGALSRRSGDHVWTILLDVEYSQVEPPLGQFHHAKADKADLLKVILSIIAATPKPRPESDIEKVFNSMWPSELEPIINRLLIDRPRSLPAPREPAAISEEILEVVRDLQRESKRVADALLVPAADPFKFVSGDLLTSDRLDRLSRLRSIHSGEGVRAWINN